MIITTDDIMVPFDEKRTPYRDNDYEYICRVCDKVISYEEPKGHTLTECLIELKRQIPIQCSCGRSR